MNRTEDLKKTMPYRIDAAMRSLPVEFCILDYNSDDGLRDYVDQLAFQLPKKIDLNYYRYTGRDSYHQAHAYNLAIMLGSGEYFCLMGSDTYPIGEYFNYVRRLAESGHIWMEEPRYKGAIACQRDEFVKAGGYDERFEFYGPEDREMAARLTRRGAKKADLPAGCIGNFHTPDDVKVANYRLKKSKKEFSELMHPIYEENMKNQTLTANPNGWGQWT